MSIFSVANTYNLRMNYGTYHAYTTSKGREQEASVSKLNYADSIALRRAVKRLANFDFEEVESSDIESRVRAFVDTYNYTTESMGKSDDKNIYKIGKEMKALAKEYSSDLENVGITFDSNGYMKMSSTAAKTIKPAKMEKMFGSDSEFMKKLDKIAKRLSKRVDTYA
ncbi:MAG: hypothetical protein IJ655_01450 [Lachnospiraceae bacterium]|nr:hypothetical protein [Lachnospiraceae bacterium]